MAFQVIWSDEAQEDIRDILSYLQDAFGDDVAERFSNRLVKVSDLLERMPRAGMRHPIFSAIRELRVPPHNMIAYTVYDQQVRVLNVIDSRRRAGRN